MKTWEELERPSDYGPETPVRIFQREWEMEQMLNLYKARQPAKLLEIGTFYGGTLYHWLRNAESLSEIVCVDTFTAADNRQHFPSWVPDGVRLDVIAGDSLKRETVEYVREFAPFDFVIIDAGHYEREVATDWANYGPMARPGGVVCFHDIVPGHGHPEIEVWKLWEQIRRSGYVTQEYVCDPDQDWGGWGVVFL